jgi:hypothetical protein
MVKEFIYIQDVAMYSILPYRMRCMTNICRTKMSHIRRWDTLKTAGGNPNNCERKVCIDLARNLVRVDIAWERRRENIRSFHDVSIHT